MESPQIPSKKRVEHPRRNYNREQDAPNPKIIVGDESKSQLGIDPREKDKPVRVFFGVPRSLGSVIFNRGEKGWVGTGSYIVRPVLASRAPRFFTRLSRNELVHICGSFGPSVLVLVEPPDGLWMARDWWLKRFWRGSSFFPDWKSILWTDGICWMNEFYIF